LNNIFLTYQRKYHRGNLEQLLQLFIANNSEYSYYQVFLSMKSKYKISSGIPRYYDSAPVHFWAKRCFQHLVQIIWKLFYVKIIHQNSLSTNISRDALKYPFEKSVNIQLQLVLKILENFDPEYAEAISIAYGYISLWS